MSTRGTTYWDDGKPMDWVAEVKPWCPECCCRDCGCPTGERLADEVSDGTQHSHTRP